MSQPAARNGLTTLRCYGDSLALPRIGFVEFHETYLYKFSSFLKRRISNLHVIDRSKASATSVDLLEMNRHDNAYFGTSVDIQIIHCGICDCAPRPLPPRARQFVSRMPPFIRNRIIAGLHNNRAALLKSGFSWKAVEMKDFQKTIETWTDMLSKHAERVYLINISPTNKQTEAHSPGLIRSISQYNQILSEAASKYSNKVSLIDVHSMIPQQSDDIDDYILKEDGHHITMNTHVLIADSLISRECEYRNWERDQ